VHVADQMMVSQRDMRSIRFLSSGIAFTPAVDVRTLGLLLEVWNQNRPKFADKQRGSFCNSDPAVKFDAGVSNNVS